MAKSGTKAIILRWLALFLIICIILITYIFNVKPLVFTYAKSVAQTIMLNAANTAVVELLSEENISYGEIAKLSYDEEGTVKSLEIDTKAVNLFKSLISNKIMEIISKETRYTVLIPLGTLSGSEYLMGLGPDIPFYMQLTETAKVDFKHKFTDAGINQVLHQIIVDIDITANIIMLGFSKGFSVSTTAIAAETVIVGAVPDSFTNVIEEPGDDIADEIFNYADID